MTTDNDQASRAGDGTPADPPLPDCLLGVGGSFSKGDVRSILADNNDRWRAALAAAPAAAPAATLTLTGDMHTMGDMGEDDMPLPETPRVVIGLADGRDLMVIGMTRNEVRALAQLFMERVTVQVGAAVPAPATVARSE